MTKQDLINQMEESGVLRTPLIARAFQKVDRADFVLAGFLNEAYNDYPLPIGFGQTISQPTTVAFMLELLQAEPSDKVLDVGSGSGWTTALLAEIVGEKGEVFGVEIIPELVKFGNANLVKYNFSNAQILLADKKLGLQAKAPFDKILVSAAASDLPNELIDQLKVGGYLVIPVGNSVFKVEKISDTEIKKTEFPGFVFVPLKD